MLTYIETIMEAVRGDYLFHGTSPDNAEAILHQNRMEARTSHRGALMVKHNGINRLVDMPVRKNQLDKHGSVRGVSMSRSDAFPRFWTDNVGVIFVLDRGAIRHTNRIVSVSYYGRKEGRRDEMEDFVIGDVENINRCIAEIRIPQALYDEIVSENEMYEPDHQPYKLLVEHPKLKIIQ